MSDYANPGRPLSALNASQRRRIVIVIVIVIARARAIAIGGPREGDKLTIDIRLVPRTRDRTPEEAAEDPMDRPGGGWRADMTPQQIWDWNRGYYPFVLARALREQYATMSVRGDRVVVAARLTDVEPVGMVRGREVFALGGDVLKPGDPDYERLMNMVIPPHRWFKYIDDGTQLPAFTCMCKCGAAVRGPDQFASGHAQRAVAERINRRWGSTVEFVKWFDGRKG
jgi:hypothetical protein